MAKVKRTEEVTIDYAGDKYNVEFVFNRGLGYINRDIPVDEDEVIIEKVIPIDNAEEINLSDLGTRWDIEKLVKEKIEI
jgi:hypothetical protein